MHALQHNIHNKRRDSSAGLSNVIWLGLSMIAFVLYHNRPAAASRADAGFIVCFLLAAFAFVLSVFAYFVYVVNGRTRRSPMRQFIAGLFTLIPPAVVAVALLPVGSTMMPLLVGAIFVFGTLGLSTLSEWDPAVRYERMSGRDRTFQPTGKAAGAKPLPEKFRTPDIDPRTIDPEADRSDSKLHDERNRRQGQSHHTRDERPDRNNKSEPKDRLPKPVNRSVARHGQQQSEQQGKDSGKHDRKHSGIDLNTVNRVVGSFDRNTDPLESPNALDAAWSDATFIGDAPFTRGYETIGDETDTDVAIDENPSDVGIERSVSNDGFERVEGIVHMQFEANQSRSVIHVPFIPPLAEAPEFECEVIDAGDVRLTVGEVKPYGVRIEGKRRDPSGVLRIEVGFLAEAPAFDR